jgi:hypothetical protein
MNNHGCPRRHLPLALYSLTPWRKARAGFAHRVGHLWPLRIEEVVRVLPGHRPVRRAGSTPKESKTCASRQRLFFDQAGGPMRYDATHSLSCLHTPCKLLPARGHSPQDGRSSVREPRVCGAMLAGRAPRIPGGRVARPGQPLGTTRVRAPHALYDASSHAPSRRAICRHGDLPTRAAAPGTDPGPGQAYGGPPGPEAAAHLLPPLAQLPRPPLNPQGYTLYPQGYGPQGRCVGCPLPTPDAPRSPTPGGPRSPPMARWPRLPSQGASTDVP